MHPDAPVRPPLDPDRARAGLPPGWRLDIVAAAPSTNALLVQRARSGAPGDLVLVAEHQTAGRGRLDRTWTTPPRSALTLSVLVRLDLPPASWPWLPLLTGVAVARTVRGVGADDAALKWPNDVLLGGRKLAGLLVERVETPTGPAAVIGIGLNVSLRRAELSVDSATSLLEEGHDVDRTDLLVALLRGLAAELGAWTDAGADPARSGLHAAYAALCTTLGRRVRVELPGREPLTGEAVRIADGGGLVVRTGTGETTVGAGDVVHVRPT